MYNWVLRGHAIDILLFLIPTLCQDKSVQAIEQGKQQAPDFRRHFIKLHAQSQCLGSVMDNLAVPGDFAGDFQQQCLGYHADVYSGS